MTYLEISGVGNPTVIGEALDTSPMMSALSWASSSAPSPDQPPRLEDRDPGKINHRQIKLTVDTGVEGTKEQIDALLAGAGLANMHSEFVVGDFPAGAFHTPDDDD